MGTEETALLAAACRRRVSGGEATGEPSGIDLF